MCLLWRQLQILYSLRGAYGRWDLNDNLTNAFGRLLIISMNETEPCTKHNQGEPAEEGQEVARLMVVHVTHF